jgi:hypothetical protein
MTDASEADPIVPAVAETRPIEWPPKSGAVAEYAPVEENFLRALVAACEAGDLDEHDLAREVGIFHDLKVLLGGRVVGDGDPGLYFGVEPVELPAPDSSFQIPARAVDLLARHDPQLRIE